MKSEKIVLYANRKVSLTTYVLDGSSEFSNIDFRPAMLILPGGGYMMCSDKEAEPIAMAYGAEGYHTFVLRYSVGEYSEWPNPLEDVEKAMEVIVSKSDEWRVDTSKIAVIGFSAGGHLAAALATIGRLKPSAVLLGYPCILEEMSGILATKVPGLETKVDSETPPAFLFTTRDDTVVPVKNTLRFLDALDEAKVPFEAHIFHSGDHGMSLAKSHTSSGYAGNINSTNGQWFGHSMAWLKQVLGDFETVSMDGAEGIGTDGDSTVYSIDTSIKVLMGHKACREVIISKLPMFANEDLIAKTLNISLRKMAEHAKGVINSDVLGEIQDQLITIKREDSENV